MKKFIIAFLFGVILFASCADISDVTRTIGDNEIVFNTNSAKTRAIVEGTTMIDNFGVYGYVIPGTYSEEGGYLMKNAEYEPTGDAANGAHYYWPKSDNNETIDILFTSYAKFDSNVEYDATTGDITISVPTFTQDLINSSVSANDFDDVIWAQTLTNHQDANTTQERVPLSFKHTLSWLGFTAEVADNASVKYVDIKSIMFTALGEGTPAIPAQPAVYDTTDTWVNLKKSSNAVATSTALKGPGETTYTNAAPIPAELVAEIKSYYSIDGGTAGDYDLKLGNSVWPSNVTYKQLRVVKDIPAEYKLTVDMHGEGIMMTFFDAVKYLKDNGYYIQSGSTGGKPSVFSDNYIILDAYVNGAAYTVTALNWGEANSVPQYTIEEVSPAVPEVPAIPGNPGDGADGIYTDGTLVLPTRTAVVTGPVPTYTGEKNTTFNFAPNAERLFGTSYDGVHSTVLSNVLIIPQQTPEYITIVFDICVKNATGDDVLMTGRKITRKINSGNDADGEHAYVSNWAASNKYLYNFRINVEETLFNVNVENWDVNTTQYHVWDY